MLAILCMKWAELTEHVGRCARSDERATNPDSPNTGAMMAERAELCATWRKVSRRIFPTSRHHSLTGVFDRGLPQIKRGSDFGQWCRS